MQTYDRETLMPSRLYLDIKNSRILFIGKLRRFFQVNLYPEKVEKQISNRKGACYQCANCCRLVYRCPFLTKDDLCKVYHASVRPDACARFPIDERDILDVHISSGFRCGYYFDCRKGEI